MSKIPPLKFQLGPHEWGVRFVDVLDGGGSHGKCDSETYTITVARSGDVRRDLDTVLHELGHSIEHTAGWDSCENRVQTYATFLLQALEPWLDKLKKSVKKASEKTSTKAEIE